MAATLQYVTRSPRALTIFASFSPTMALLQKYVNY